ncbi:MAG: rod shape-determining protein MreC [Pseudarcicella sp.]|jgi:rod shape-determining protein MreC|nr:rod shape-determining protein MreC [Pseudarcicella sp.]MBP6410289.1 rod shape-determining protein MreC [Pseudarcicella sp.]
MKQLFEFISQKRAFIIFFLLEVLCLWCAFTYNNYQNALLFNTTNSYVAKTLQTSNAIKEYANLKNANIDLAQENAQLQALLYQKNIQEAPKMSLNYRADSALQTRFKPMVAKVIELSTNQVHNYITIDKGFADGLKPGMGVISPTGLVGKIKKCSEHLSLVISILHTDYTVSSKIKSINEIGYVKWEGKNPEKMTMMDVSRYKNVKKGDSIMTSDFNSVYPPNIMIGIVNKVGLQKDNTFLDISLKPSTNFHSLSYVYVIENKLSDEIEKLKENIENTEKNIPKKIAPDTVKK